MRADEAYTNLTGTFSMTLTSHVQLFIKNITTNPKIKFKKICNPKCNHLMEYLFKTKTDLFRQHNKEDKVKEERKEQLISQSDQESSNHKEHYKIKG